MSITNIHHGKDGVQRRRTGYKDRSVLDTANTSDKAHNSQPKHMLQRVELTCAGGRVGAVNVKVG